MPKKKKQKRRQSVKTIKLNQNFLVHELAQIPYKIFCEMIGNVNDIELTEIDNKTPLFEVMKSKDGCLFFEDFGEVSQLIDGMSISIRQVDISNTDVERRAWRCLIYELIMSDSIDPLLMNRVKNEMPHHIQIYFFDGTLTIQKILDQKNIPRHQYDYRLQKSQNLNPHRIPSFSNLIQEARNDN